VGFLSLGGKLSRYVYTNTDLSLLTAIAMQAAVRPSYAANAFGQRISDNSTNIGDKDLIMT
jgi:hypothetical protein